jgi:NAD(P)-dependent dehydrogenase (short-subunit alcohol dehydrogenase family)
MFCMGGTIVLRRSRYKLNLPIPQKNHSAGKESGKNEGGDDAPAIARANLGKARSTSPGPARSLRPGLNREQGMARTAFVTGSSQGIGAATARTLAAQGWRVIVHYGGSRDKAEALVAEIRESGAAAELVGGDLSDPGAPRVLAAEVATLCPEGLQALVLNAAVMPASDIATCSEETFDRIVTVNLRAPFFLLQALSSVLEDGAGVVFVSSLTARRVTGGVAAYATMKGGTETLVRRAAQEFGARGIRVNAVAPGTTATGPIAGWAETPAGFKAIVRDQALKRVAQPDDIAGPIAFLLGDAARWITGAVIPVDGGALL